MMPWVQVEGDFILIVRYENSFPNEANLAHHEKQNGWV